MLYDDVIHASLLRLSNKFDENVTRIPVNVSETYTTPYTDNTGIFLPERFVKQDPSNIEVYIAHEIFHDVIKNPILASQYSAMVLNIAEDIKINYLLKKHYNYDVLKVKFKGIYKKKYDGWDIEDIIKDLKLKSSPTKFIPSIKHPNIIYLANRLRNKLNISTEKDVVTNNLKQEFLFALRKQYGNFMFPNLPTVDVEKAAFGLWTRLYSNPEWNHLAFGKVLTPTQAIVLACNIQQQEIKDPEAALFATYKIMEHWNNCELVLHSLIKLTDKKISNTLLRLHDTRRLIHSKKLKMNYERLSSYKALVEDRIFFKAKIRSLHKKLSYYSGLPLISTLLLEGIPIPARKLKVNYLTSRAIHNSQTPKFSANHKLIFMLRFIFNVSYKHIEDSIELFHQVEDNFGNMFNDVQEEIEESDNGGNQTSQTENNSEVESEEESDDTVEEESGKEDTNKLKSNYEKSFASKELFKGNNRIKAIETIHSNPNLIKMIIKESKFFQEKLVIKPNFTPRDGSLDRTLSFGDDISNIVNSEFARLKNKFTKLSFLSDLANSKLVQYSDLDSLRSPIILLLDVSGSMQGKRYATASAFCLSMITMLTKADRGWALITFSERVTNVFTSKGKVKMSELLKILLNPKFGGTDFNGALLSAFEVHTSSKWKESQVIMVTDGEDYISPTTVELKPRNAKVTMVLVSKSRRSNLLGIDEIVYASPGKLGLELVKVANSKL